ncbi:MAG: NAD(P)/FAD-dependent oxidoreductase [Gammaproteobacteria bacterium]|nr:NAD(P)/FAD-dependent oxidoreductase [Gammaproteobacteria bacterium]
MAAERVDVVVVGLGPAGASAARSAAARGCRVVAVDRRLRAGYPVQCAELVPGLVGQDVAAFAPAVRQPVQRMLTRVEDGTADERAPFPGFMIDRARFDRQLVDAARAAGAECRFAQPVTAVDACGRVVLAGGGVLEGAVVIGADGPRSRVGRALGAVNRELVYARQYTVPLRAASDATDIFLSAEITGGYGWLFPRGSHAHLGVGVTAGARARLGALLAALHAELRRDGRVGRRSHNLTGGTIPVGGRLPPQGCLGERLVLLAGDAAGLVNPVSGAGIHAAVVSGGLAGSAAADRLEGHCAAGDDYAEEIADLFGRALDHALMRRRQLWRQPRPSRAALRTGWIAYPAYWTAAADPATA